MTTRDERTGVEREVDQIEQRHCNATGFFQPRLCWPIRTVVL
jgi:hypothetical protein